METVNLEISGTVQTIIVEETYNELLQEVNFVATWPTGAKFLMAFDFKKDRLAINGQAPYDAMEYQDLLSKKIEAIYC